MNKETVNIVEVSPRDGLQNQATFVATAEKIKLINSLTETGLNHIETTSFVSPKWIPQFKDAAQVLASIEKNPAIQYTALVPNVKGMENALAQGVKSIAIFTAASESFCQKNINCSIGESIERFKEVATLAKQQSVKIRAYISCAMGCPYEGEIKFSAVCNVSEQLFELGAYEVSIGDTIGVGYPEKTKNLFKELTTVAPIKHFALHCHDTYGMAIANIYAACEMGVRTFDGAVAGLGGCPYAPGAQGNVATEDIIYLLEKQGFDTGVDLRKLSSVGNTISASVKPKQSFQQ